MSGLGVGDLAFQSLEAFKVRHKNKPFTLTHCWSLIKNFPRFKDQYATLKKKGGKAVVAGDGYLVKRPRGKTNSKIDEKCDAASFALQETLHDMMTQKEERDKRKRQGKEERMKIYLELQTKELDIEEVTKKTKRQGKEEQMKIYLELHTKKLDMEEAAKKRKLDVEEVAQTKKLAIEATNADTKPKEVAPEIMSVDLTNMSSKRRSWFKSRQKEMFDRDGMN
ncbi:hypothetical protein VPH35_091814 [Triticum aestivum]